jgi:CHAD domain-containing protein
MTGLLQRGPLRRSPHSRRPVLLAGPEVVRRARRKVKRRGDAIGAESPPEDLHRLRIAGKRLRYAVEFLEPLYGRPARRLAKRLSSLQDVLGLHQDAQVAMAHLRELVRDEGEQLPPAAIFALGRVAERFRAQAEEQRGLLDRAYARVRGRTWRALRRRMDSGQEEAEAAGHQRGGPRRPAIHRPDETAASSAVPA